MQTYQKNHTRKKLFVRYSDASPIHTSIFYVLLYKIYRSLKIENKVYFTI
jgi:hypothetical protein